VCLIVAKEFFYEVISCFFLIGFYYKILIGLVLIGYVSMNQTTYIEFFSIKFKSTFYAISINQRSP
jgi:hypothetical protein